MIGWRIGWLTAPTRKVADVRKAHSSNVVTAPGISQRGALTALQQDEPAFQAALQEWERRHDVVCEELTELPYVRADGGWSLLLDVEAMGWSSKEASARLLADGRIATTPMAGWGDADAARFVRLVFSREPVERLGGFGDRVRRALPVRQPSLRVALSE